MKPITFDSFSYVAKKERTRREARSCLRRPSLHDVAAQSLVQHGCAAGVTPVGGTSCCTTAGWWVIFSHEWVRS
jgi:hypothetical protein